MPIPAPGEYQLVRAGAQSATFLFWPSYSEETGFYSLKFTKPAWDQLPKGLLKDVLTRNFDLPEYAFDINAAREACFVAYAEAGFEASVVGFLNDPEYTLQIDMAIGDGFAPADWFYPFVSAFRGPDAPGGLSYLKLSVNYSASE